MTLSQKSVVEKYREKLTVRRDFYKTQLRFHDYKIYTRQELEDEIEDYNVEIGWFDQMLAEIRRSVEERHEENSNTANEKGRHPNNKSMFAGAAAEDLYFLELLGTTEETTK